MERYARVFFVPLFPYLCCFSFFFVFGLAANSFQQVPGQRDIMTNLSKNLPTSQTIRVWNSTTDMCHWVGVTCSRANSSVVTSLSLSGFGLSSTNSSVSKFFDLLCLLRDLKSLDLSQNSLTAIPISFFSECSGLSGLESLNLSYNGLTGPLPSFSGFGALQSLDISYNFFHGAVDSGLEKLTGLKLLNLSFNSFNSTIPARVGGATAPSLEVLVLSSNSFHGEIPERIFDYEKLTLLDLSQNNLTGPIPDGIGRLSRLKVLVLSSNHLSGRIPTNLTTIKTLSRFAANQNNFNGSIPRGITTYVSALDLSYNGLTGEIPPDLLSPRNLEFVDLTGNHLQGPIPGSWSQRLYRLRLGNNNLNGSIPSTVGKLSNLTYLELNDNVLGGEISSGLGNCRNLMLLDLSSNRLQGNLTKELGYLAQLVVLKLQHNNIGGGIPDELLFKFRNLSNLDLSKNLLTGVMPPAISNLKKLSVLNLQSNSLYGSIPASIGSLENLMELQLGNNKLSGTVPRMPKSLRMTLNLRGNLFNGLIPSYLGDLSQLEILDLSSNKFSGEVPTSLATIQSLIELNLSDNQLSGVLPNFPKFVKVVTTGNKDLIISNSSSNTNPSSHTIPTKRKQNILLIIMVIIGAVIGMGLTAAVLLLIISKRFYRVEDEGPQPEENLPQVISGCFITANGIHRSSIDFTKTMEMVSNPANIIMKSRFSTYYKAVMPNGVSYSVKKLNWTDKIFQTGNHERFGRELEVLGRLSNSNVMIPLAYVLTEDSAYLFYEHVHKGTVFDFLHKDSENALDWPSRYTIALGVAQGLTFLHGCDQPVILLDLSTKSVRLKSVKEPQIGDIELCKVIDPSKSTGSFSMVAGSVGYIPPEYAYTMRITMAGNAYSFGVILLELLTGKPPMCQGIELAKWALSYSTRLEEREKILDSRVCKASLAVHSQMLSVLKVALACVSISPEARPKMRSVLRMLFNAR
ncbi:receptor-like protein kinase [Cocos nucifera]|uniref:Receptor-like protein kinase n=1 Tax=Cocos nucifera TaxID=13894 RepID=A0A8K0IX03_COCNU|nr:receptor-like protein kinase [Cocos nucifera]